MRLLAVGLLAALLSGCVSHPVEQAGLVGDLGPLETATAILPADGADAIRFLDGYVMTHAHRNNKIMSTDSKARDDLAKSLTDMGLDVRREKYSGGENILGIKNGTSRADEWIVLSAHYDTAESTIYGAWDDGAGTAMLLGLAKAGAQSSFDHTIVYAFFDGEEQGLQGSRAFVTEHLDKVKLVANLNFDPPGLNWPCKDAQGPFPVKIILNSKKTANGTRGYPEMAKAILDALNTTKIPDKVRDFDSAIPIATLNGVGLSGTSDHASFDKVDVPNVFIGSAPTSRAGPAAALSYLLHTPLDTRQQMAVRCGGDDLLKGAFQVEMDLTTAALKTLDTSTTLSES